MEFLGEPKHRESQIKIIFGNAQFNVLAGRGLTPLQLARNAMLRPVIGTLCRRVDAALVDPIGEIGGDRHIR